jgi:type III pantothenate kinase
MNLLLDIGNTRVKWAQADGARLRATGSLGHRDAPDWPAALPEERPAAVWVANVADETVPAALARHAGARWRLTPHPVHSTVAACGVRNAYARPERLGVDRWLACIGAFHRGAGSVLVVDAGTALTLDLVAPDGRHRGGLIAPGLTTMRTAIAGGTRLRAEVGEYAPAWLADDTDPAVALGTLQAVLSLIGEARRALAPDRLLLTGGEADRIAPHLGCDWEQAPELVLEGLARLAAASDN